MLNQTVLVGRLIEEPTKEENKSYIKIAVPRSFKNEEGIYENDEVPCTLYNGISQQVEEYCQKGDLIGIKGRIQATEDKIEIIAERVTILSSKKEKE